jgi:hypothetical protein
MKRIILPLAYLSLFSVLLLTTSCETDGTTDPGGNALGPDVTLLGDVGFITTNTQVSPGETFKVKVSAVAGDANLKSLTIKEGGVNVPSGRLTISVNGTDVTNNPLLITSAFASGATWEISIVAPTDAAVRTYQFTVSDEANLSESVSVDVEVFGQLAVSLARGNDAVTVLGKSDYSVSVVGTRGGSALNTLAVYANDTLVPFDSLTFGATAVAANPIVLVGTEKAAFDTGLMIKTGSQGTTSYRIDLTDESGAVVSTAFDLTVLVEYTALIVNNRSGQRFGGLDLDNGLTVPFNSMIAEIRDNGIDTNLPVDQNWKQTISPVNGAELRIPASGQAENFSYDNANSRAAIIGAFDTGEAKTESDQVQVDDLFLVKRADNYYLLKCTKVDITNSDNNDFYEFSVKQVQGKE